MLHTPHGVVERFELPALQPAGLYERNPAIGMASSVSLGHEFNQRSRLAGGQMFRHKVRWVGLPTDLMVLHLFCVQQLLDPQVSYPDMPKLAIPFPGRDS